MKLSIVIPVFNEEAVIRTTHKRVVALLEKLQEKGVIHEYEILYVDDGSRDGTFKILQEFSAGSPSLKVLSFTRNFGHQPALAAGIIHSSGDVVASLDADLQDPPELIEEMVGKYLQGNDIVYAVRDARPTDSKFKRGTAMCFYRLLASMGVDIIYAHADYRLISRRVVEVFRSFREVNLFLRGIFPYLGFPYATVTYSREARFAGKTKYPLRKMIRFAWEGITSFSNLPLRIASLVGFGISLFSLVLTFWAFYTKFSGRAIPGWASTVIPLLLIGGLNILFLGIVGEYVGKIYLEVKNRPLFVIRDKLNFDGPEDQYRP